MLIQGAAMVCSSKLVVTEIDDPDTVSRVIRKGLGSWHAYYARACLEERVCRSLAAYIGDDVVGVSLYYTVPLKPYRAGVVYYIVVDDRFRGMGIGKALLASTEEVLDERKCGVILSTTTLDNDVMIRIFRSFGYTVVLWNDLAMLFGDDVELHLLRLTCGFEDDVIAFKCLKCSSLEDFISKLMSRDNLAKIVDVWDTICYGAWLRYRGRYT